MKTTNDENKIWFEQNFLDGDKIQDGQMLSSSLYFEAIQEMRKKTIDECIACVGKEKQMGVFSFFLQGEELEDYMKNKGHNTCREQTITNLNNLKNNEQ